MIGSAEDRWLNEVDPKNRELLLSVGAFLENMVIVANAYGFQAKIRMRTQNAFDPELLSIEFKNAERVEYPLQRLLERRTLRSGFKSDDLDPEDVSFITGGDENCFYYPSFSKQAAWLDEATVAASRQQADRMNVQEELARWIRWSDSDARKNRNGLTPESMDITGLAGWYVRNFYGADDVLNRDFRNASVERARKQVTESGGWIVITSTNDTPESLLEAGRRFERLFLKAKDRSIAIHPMSQVLQEQPWAEKATAELRLTRPLQMLLRVGYPRDYPSPVSLRMPLDAFTTIST